MAVPLNDNVSPNSNLVFVGFMIIILSVSTVYALTIVSLPSVISTLYFPSGASNGTIIGFGNFQVPFDPTSAESEVVTFPSGLTIFAVTALPGCAVPEISNDSPLKIVGLTPLIVNFIFSAGTRSSIPPNLILIFFSFPLASFIKKFTLSALIFSGISLVIINLPESSVVKDSSFVSSK